MRSAPVTFATKAEAEAWLVTVRADMLRGQWAPPERARVIFADYVETWLRHRAAHLRPRTLDLYVRLAERWLLAPVGTGRHAVELGPVPLPAISAALVREWFAAVTTEARVSAGYRTTPSNPARPRVRMRHARIAPPRAWALANGIDIGTRGQIPRHVLDAWKRAGAPFTPSATPRQHVEARPSTEAGQVRAWALSQGLDVKATGRLSPAIVAAWRAAGSPTVTTPTPTPARPGAGATAAAQAYRLVHAILAEAVNDGLLATNPARIPGAGHVAHAERIPLNPAEVAALAAAMPDRYRAAVLVAAWSGLRPGEVFALRRGDVDFATGQLTVRRALVELPGQPVTFGPPKSAAGLRTVALPATVLDALRAHLARHTDTGHDALIFTTTTGQPVTAQARSHALRTPRKAIGRPDLTWHHLRHTGATLAAQAGATPAELQRRIGHSTARAANLYQHASLTRDHLIATALN
ncbi:tyrosine-type recombinase/integrase, partial [Demequina sp.]|uniref:tyrosine-type recombinase/integrase n=1 Tax=Demequina sp. TaxID=2050685 RepID=UPI003D0C4B2F